MKHEVSNSDLEFRTAFEAGAYAPADFSHRAHVRLAYVYLATNDVERATTLETGHGDREQNMWAFASAALKFLETALR